MTLRNLNDELQAAYELLSNAMYALENIDVPSEHVRRALLSMDEAARYMRIERSYRENPPASVGPMYGA